jgi:hypothetical protein
MKHRKGQGYAGSWKIDLDDQGLSKGGGRRDGGPLRVQRGDIMGIRIGISREREPLQVSSMCYVDTDGDREVIPGVEWDMVTKGW